MISRNRQTAICVAVDWVSTSAAVLLFNIARYFLHIPAAEGISLRSALLSRPAMAEELLFPAGMLLVYYLTGYYTHIFSRSRVNELMTTLGSAFAGALLFLFIELINDGNAGGDAELLSFLLLFLLLFIIVYLPRLLVTSLTIRRLSDGRIFFPAAIIGPGRQPLCFDRLSNLRSPVVGIRPVVEIYSDNVVPPGHSGVKFSEIESAVSRYGISHIIVFPADDWSETEKVLDRLYVFGKPIYVAAAGLPADMLNNRLVSFTADPYIDVTNSHIPASTICMKRAFDIVCSSLILIVSAIPVALMAAAIRLTSSGPAFYSQKRIGRHRRPFTIYKLRSMTADAEADGKPRLSTPDDPRITPLGRFLRKYRLDELPQFYNVLRGDMSIVGPRPERPEFVAQIEALEPRHSIILGLKPGITSLGMVKYGYASTVEQMIERMRYDFIYLQNISIINDIKIITYTFATVFLGKGI